MMKTKKQEISNYEKVMSKLVIVVGKIYDEEELTHYECIGVFESAKQLFIDIQNKKKEENDC